MSDQVPSVTSNDGATPRPSPPWLESALAQATPVEKQLWAALEEVEDPEMPVSVVDMGLIYKLAFTNGRVHIDLTFTAMGCPCMEFIISDIRERLLKETIVTQVTMEIVWDPPWTRQRLTPKGLDKLRNWGITV